MDVFSPTKRSAIMAAVASRNTKPEERIAAVLRAAGVRYRRHVDRLPGSPDFLVPAARLAIFVNGCFWHGHDCPAGRKQPKSNQAYWTKKIAGNIRRDRRARRELRASGYAVHTIWTCRMKRGWTPTRVLLAIERRLR